MRGSNPKTVKAHWLLAMALMISLCGICATPDHSSAVPYPTGYRLWTFIKTMVVGPQSPFFQSGGGMHYIYANQLAMRGYAEGRFRDGSIFVLDLFGTVEKQGTISQGARTRIDVMLKNSQRCSSTGGWCFERFMGDGQTPALTEAHRKLCYSCHQRAKQDFVFSKFHK